jgi:predicted TIM-barrel fold metal-dependent hydrolase
MRIVDTHCHLIYRGRVSYPWLASVPALNRDFTLEDYLPQARAAGITDVLHMEVDVAEPDMDAETVFASGLGGAVGGVIAACRPERADFPAYLDRVAINPKVKGLRRVLHVQPDTLAEAPIFAENLRRLAVHRLTFDLCVLPRQLPAATALARRCAEVQFVLDHCGNPNIKDRQLDPWRDHIRAIAALPNVACKLSGIVTNADPSGWTVEDLRPAVDHVIACFGPDRLVWGSDWPVCTLAADLARWIEATHQLLAGASEGERARVLAGNAERIYCLRAG